MTDAADLMSTLFRALDERRWDDLPALLADDFRCTFTHTGETFDRDAFVRLQADYPVRVRLDVAETVAQDDKAVVLARVFNADESHHVASFGRASGGLLTSLVEVWAEDTGDSSGTPRAPG